MKYYCVCISIATSTFGLLILLQVAMFFDFTFFKIFDYCGIFAVKVILIVLVYESITSARISLIILEVVLLSTVLLTVWCWY